MSNSSKARYKRNIYKVIVILWECSLEIIVAWWKPLADCWLSQDFPHFHSGAKNDRPLTEPTIAELISLDYPSLDLTVLFCVMN